MGYRLIDVSDEAHPSTFVMVDEPDYHFLTQWDWFISDSGYAIRKITFDAKVYVRYMHKIVLDIPDELMGDHVSGNKLDNRRTNLRAATPRQNSQNRARNEKRAHGVIYKGVYKNFNCSTFTARITTTDRRHIYLGSFDCQVDAARAYDDAAIEHFGDRARLNFSDKSK